MTTCADCGAEVVERRGRWADQRTEDGHAFVCRYQVIINDNGDPVLLSADYHHVEGESQRLFRHLVKDKS